MSKKRKHNDLEGSIATTTSSSEDKPIDRTKLKAKRLFPPSDADNKKSNDTPQMRKLREQMQQRQLQGNAPRRSKISSSPNIRSSSRKIVKRKFEDTISNDCVKLTAQMRAVRESISSKKSLGSVKSRQTVDPGVNEIKTVEKQSQSSSSTSNILNNQITNKSSRKSIRIDEKITRIRTSEAPPGVSAVRTIIEDKEAEPTKNLAEHRLKKLRTSLELTKKKMPENNSTSSKQADYPTRDTSDIYDNMEQRHRQILQRLKHQANLEAENRKTIITTMKCPESELTLNDLMHITEPYYEAMEWEPIEEEKIVQEIKSMRAELTVPIESIESHLKVTPENPLVIDKIDNATIQPLYIVIDTNVFLANLQSVENARDAVFEHCGRPFIVIPWIVLRELDFIKDDKSKTRTESLKAKARLAIRFIHKHFTARHPRVLGQTQFDVIKNRQQFECLCPDDDILQTCLQIRETKNSVVLLSYDRNLCNKAMFHDIITIGRMDSLEKIDYLQESENRRKSMLSVTLRMTSVEPEEPKSPRNREIELTENLYEEITSLLNSFMTVIVAKEMKDLFGENWVQHTTITPPWTITLVLKCAMKHWLAAVSESFVKPAESIVKEINEAIKKLQYSRRLNDMNYLIERSFDLFQCVKNIKHPGLLEKFTEVIMELRKKYAQAVKTLHDYELFDIGGNDMSEEEQQQAANRAFDVFDDAYKYARDFCGTIGELIGMPCLFAYTTNQKIKLNPESIYQRPQMTGDVNQLLQILSNALDNLDDIHPNHSLVHALYNSLTVFERDESQSNSEKFQFLQKLDIYWCLKKKTEALKIGLKQFQSVSEALCQIASWMSD